MTRTVAIPPMHPITAPNSVGARDLMRAVSGLINPKNTGKTAVAQTKSATRKRPRTLYLCADLSTAMILTMTRMARLSHLMRVGFSEKYFTKVELRMHVIPFCRLSTELAARDVTKMRTSTCHPWFNGSLEIIKMNKCK